MVLKVETYTREVDNRLNSGFLKLLGVTWNMSILGVFYFNRILDAHTNT